MKLLEKQNKLVEEYNKVKATVVEVGQKTLPTSPSSTSPQDKDTLKLRIDALKKELQVTNSEKNKLQENMYKIAKDMAEEILGHKLTKAALKAEVTWLTYKGIHEAFERFQHVQEVFKSTWNKWSSRLNSLREIQVNAKEDPEAPTDLQDIIRGIEMIGEVTRFHERIGGKLQGKIKAFRDMEEQGVPKILNEAGTLKEYELWRSLFRHETTMGPHITYIDDKLELTMLNGVIVNFIMI